MFNSNFINYSMLMFNYMSDLIKIAAVFVIGAFIAVSTTAMSIEEPEAVNSTQLTEEAGNETSVETKLEKKLEVDSESNQDIERQIERKAEKEIQEAKQRKKLENRKHQGFFSTLFSDIFG